MKNKSQLKPIVKTVRKKASDRPATYGMLKAVERRLEHKIDGTVKRSDGRFNRVDARFNKVDARFDKVDARFNDLEAKIDDIRAEVQSMRLLAEEQRAENRVVIDGLRAVLDLHGYTDRQHPQQM